MDPLRLVVMLGRLPETITMAPVVRQLRGEAVRFHMILRAAAQHREGLCI